MFKRYGRILSAVVVLMATGCTGVVGSGDPISEVRDVSDFARLTVEDGIDVDITVGKATSVVVRGDDNIVRLVETNVSGDELQIRTEDHTTFISREPLRVTVTVPVLVALSAFDGSDVVATDLSTRELTVNAGDGSDVTVAGMCEDLQAFASGGSDLSLRDLTAQTARMVASDGSDVVARVITSAVVEASDGSDVTIAGGATVRKTTSDGSRVHIE